MKNKDKIYGKFILDVYRAGDKWFFCDLPNDPEVGPLLSELLSPEHETDTIVLSVNGETENTENYPLAGRTVKSFTISEICYGNDVKDSSKKHIPSNGLNAEVLILWGDLIREDLYFSNYRI